jgi:hypothetical protein
VNPVAGAMKMPDPVLVAAVEKARALQAELAARRAERDIVFWLRHCTKTRDEQDKENPNKPFPDEEYIWKTIEVLQREPVTFVEKSRTVMGTWIGCAVLAHEGFTTPQMKYVFHAPDERRAINCIKYVKALWQNSTEELKSRWALKKPIEMQAQHVFELENGTIFEAIAGGADKIRSAHPTAYMMDEGAFIDDGAECFDVAQAANPLKLFVISSASPGWFRDATEDAMPDADSPMPQGMALRRTASGTAVLRIHYTADTKKRGEWAEKQKKKYVKKSNWDLEMEIKYDAKKGTLVYPEFDVSLHVVKDSMVPKRGCLFMAADPHPRTPHAFLWVLISRDGDWWVYRDFWPSKMYGVAQELKDGDPDNLYTAREYAETIARLEGNRIMWVGKGDDARGDLIESGEKIWDRFMDQAGKGFQVSAEGQPFVSYWDRYHNCGYRFKEPYKIHQAGEDRIRELLAPRPHEIYGQWPTLHIAESCRELILEFGKYRYQAMSESLMDRKELPQKGVEKRCHLLDCLRYIATSPAQYIRGFESDVYRPYPTAIAS